MGGITSSPGEVRKEVKTPLGHSYCRLRKK